MAHVNTGGLWPNQYRGSHAKRPHLVGTLNIDGKEIKIAGWYNKDSWHTGKPEISIRVAQDVPSKPDDDIPF